jgi:hypothetical protein
MCGPEESILGRQVEPIVARFQNNLPIGFPVAKGLVRLCGMQVDVDESTGRALAVERFVRMVEPQ